MAKDEELDVDDIIYSSDIQRIGDSVRKQILDNAQINAENIAPSVFTYQKHDNCFGLNEISNVDMGYAGTTVSNDGSHAGKRNPYLNELEYNVGLMKESDNSIVVLNGGLFTYVPKSRNGQMLSYKDQIAYFYSLFKDLAKDGKIVAMVRGTEEHRILKNHGIDTMGILQDALGLSGRVCNDALINIKLDDDFIPDAKATIRTINWNNTATTGAYIGRKMEERATKKSGADIFLARTVVPLFKVMTTATSEDGGSIKKPAYLISSGSYTPFKGAMTAGAEYNSVKDMELCPPPFWYKVTVEENKTATKDSEPYFVRVAPISYLAHQVTTHGTDEVTAKIMDSITNNSDKFVEYVLKNYPKIVDVSRSKAREDIREILSANKTIAEHNALVEEFRKYKKDGKNNDSLTNQIATEYLGSNVADATTPETHIHFDGEELEK